MTPSLLTLFHRLSLKHQFHPSENIHTSCRGQPLSFFQFNPCTFLSDNGKKRTHTIRQGAQHFERSCCPGEKRGVPLMKDCTRWRRGPVTIREDHGWQLYLAARVGLSGGWKPPALSFPERSPSHEAVKPKLDTDGAAWWQRLGRLAASRGEQENTLPARPDAASSPENEKPTPPPSFSRLLPWTWPIDRPGHVLKFVWKRRARSAAQFEGSGKFAGSGGEFFHFICCGQFFRRQFFQNLLCWRREHSQNEGDLAMEL